MKSSENFALTRYTYNFEMFKSFKTNCRVTGHKKATTFA